LVISKKVPDSISDCLIIIFSKTLVEEFEGTFKTKKNNIRIENQKYDPQDILHIA